VLPLYFAAYGIARAEKGSDLFQSAIEKYLTLYPESRIRFGIQWMEAFEGGQGNLISVADTLTLSTRVDVIRSYFQEGEYSAWLLKTSALVLPYRSSSYALRVSRVVIEAMVNGIPVITTDGSTLWSQLERFGAGVSCKDEDVNSLVFAIRDMELKYQELYESAILSKQKAREHFSVTNFRQILKSFIS
jgi:glycosyltransferase involved in cell wall biosynthesis